MDAEMSILIQGWFKPGVELDIIPALIRRPGHFRQRSQTGHRHELKIRNGGDAFSPDAPFHAKNLLELSRWNIGRNRRAMVNSFRSIKQVPADRRIRFILRIIKIAGRPRRQHDWMSGGQRLGEHFRLVMPPPKNNRARFRFGAHNFLPACRRADEVAAVRRVARRIRAAGPRGRTRPS